MDQDYKTYLSKRGISEDKYNDGSLDAQATLVQAFEKSKRGRKSPHSFHTHSCLTVILPLFITPLL